MKKIKFYINVFLVLSLIFLIPLEISFAEKVDVGPIYMKQGDISKACGSDAGFNVKDSLVLSVVTMCLPGILEKTHDYMEIKCQRIVCEYNAVKNGLDPAYCNKQEAYQQCVYVVGEVFALPPMAMLEYYRKAIANIIANPVGVIWSVATVAARKTVFVQCKAPSCNCHTGTNPMFAAAKFFLLVTDSMYLYQTIKDIQKNGFFPPGIGDKEDYCKMIPDIEKEIKPILDYYNDSSTS
jgi:hypothetical protein